MHLHTWGHDEKTGEREEVEMEDFINYVKEFVGFFFLIGSEMKSFKQKKMKNLCHRKITFLVA